jgi:hypothetical protein
MVASERDLAGSDDSRRKIIIGAAVVAALVIAGVFYFLLRASSGSNVDPVLEGAIRPGSPEFAQFHSKIVLDAPEADEAKRALGDIVMNLQTTVRNFTGRTINGLEIKGAVVDQQGKPVKERTVIVIPTKQPELEANKTVLVSVRLEGMTEADHRANIRMEVTGFKFKP